MDINDITTLLNMGERINIETKKQRMVFLNLYGKPIPPLQIL